MNPAQLLAHFDRISDTPDAIPRLRRFVLDLAVRGKLVEQDPRDEPATELLKNIDEQNPLGENTTVPLEENEQLFRIPQSWVWIRIGNAAHVEMGQSPPSESYNQSGDGIPFYQGKTDFGERHPSARYWCNLPSKLAQENDILISVRAPVGPTNVASEKCCIGRGLAALRPRNGVYLEFLLYSLKGFESAIAEMGYGTTFVAITKKQLISFPVPLPPLAEQHRIVAKVDELMALCDRLEAAQAERERRRDRLAASSLNRLNNGAEPDAFQDHARFYFNNLPRLTTRHKHVKKLRGAILNLAFRGRLTSPWRETAAFVGTAQEFRLSVENARKKAWDNKQVAGSSRKYLAPIEFDRENLPTIPDSWVWASADAVCSQITDGEHIQPRYQPEGLPMLTAKHVREGFVTFEDSELISESDFKKCVARCKPEEGDILVVSVGATTGRAAIVSQSRPFALVRSVLLLKPLISPAYFLRWLQSPWCFVWMRQASEASAQPHLYIGDTRRMPVPLPPLAEQQRIVAKVDELLALCDRLEAQLITTHTESSRFFGAVLHEALAT